MKIIFFGSDDFAQAYFNAIIQSHHQIEACVAPPDRPKDRGMKIKDSPVKESALNAGIPLLQPDSVKKTEFIDQVKAYQADAFVVIAYGQILSQEILNIPPLGAFNVHGSLLPKYRGAAPINWAVMNKEGETGISVIKMNAKMDAGDIIGSLKFPITKNDTAGIIRTRMMEQGPAFLIGILDQISANQYTQVVQDENQVTFAPKLDKNTGLINWSTSAVNIHCLVKGLHPKPGAYTYLNGKKLKVLSAKPVESTDGKFAEIVDITSEGFVVGTADGGLLIQEVHLESAKPMDAKSFINGYAIKIGMKLGS